MIVISSLCHTLASKYSKTSVYIENYPHVKLPTTEILNVPVDRKDIYWFVWNSF